MSSSAAAPAWDGRPDADERLLAECRAASTRGLRGAFWRGKRCGEGARPTRRAFGLAPPAEAEPGRFGDRHETALYLAADPCVVAAECPPEKGRPVLFAQRFDVDLPGARVLRRPLRPDRALPTLCARWAEADRLAEVGRGDGRYALTQALARRFRDAGVDAVLYPSAAAGRGDARVNVALFGEAARRAAATMMAGRPVRVDE